jgi:hypothetical protein
LNWHQDKFTKDVSATHRYFVLDRFKDPEPEEEEGEEDGEEEEEEGEDG